MTIILAFTFSNLVNKLRCSQSVQLWTQSEKRILSIEHEEIQIQVWNYEWHKSWGKMQEVSRKHNIWQNRDQIATFTVELWYYDVFWLTSTNVLRLGGVTQEVSYGFFLSTKRIKNNFIAFKLYVMPSS